MQDSTWGSDSLISLPKVLDDDEVVLVDFGSHVFTPNGLRLKMSPESKTEILASGRGPVDPGMAT